MEGGVGAADIVQSSEFVFCMIRRSMSCTRFSSCLERPLKLSGQASRSFPTSRWAVMLSRRLHLSNACVVLARPPPL